MAVIKPELTQDIRKYGDFDFSACYNCGNCTAVCNLTAQDANFPRMMLRYSMLGLKQDILSSKELWLCYACGDCTAACPREAAPGDLMASLRRYAIAQYEPSGLTRLLFKNKLVSVLFTLVLAIVLGFFAFSMKPDMEISRWLFKHLSYEVIHLMGMIIMGFMAVSALTGVFIMWRHLLKKGLRKDTKPFLKRFIAAAGKVISEVAVFKRYRDCNTDHSVWSSKPWLVQPWFIHWTIMWGFIGLLVATILDFMFKDPMTDIWWPTRILGTLAGLSMVYGSVLALYYRITKITETYARTRLADWMFLGFLLLAGLTGFWLELAVFFKADVLTNHLVFLVHVIVSMELVILFAFSKFAHAFYRPLALLVHYY